MFVQARVGCLILFLKSTPRKIEVAKDFFYTYRLYAHFVSKNIIAARKVFFCFGHDTSRSRDLLQLHAPINNDNATCYMYRRLDSLFSLRSLQLTEREIRRKSNEKNKQLGSIKNLSYHIHTTECSKHHVILFVTFNHG